MTEDLPVDQRPDLLPDEVEASRAPLLEHLNELRSRLMKALINARGTNGKSLPMIFARTPPTGRSCEKTSRRDGGGTKRNSGP